MKILTSLSVSLFSLLVSWGCFGDVPMTNGVNPVFRVTGILEQ